MATVLLLIALSIAFSVLIRKKLLRKSRAVCLSLSFTLTIVFYYLLTKLLLTAPNTVINGSYSASMLLNLSKQMSLSLERDLCPKVAPNLGKLFVKQIRYNLTHLLIIYIVGLINVSQEYVKLEEVEEGLSGIAGLEAGGRYKPPECRSRHKVAIVVPFRDRHEQLPIFLQHLHPILQRQQLAYTIFIVEQTRTYYNTLDNINKDPYQFHSSYRQFGFQSGSVDERWFYGSPEKRVLRVRRLSRCGSATGN